LDTRIINYRYHQNDYKWLNAHEYRVDRQNAMTNQPSAHSLLVSDGSGRVAQNIPQAVPSAVQDTHHHETVQQPADNVLHTC